MFKGQEQGADKEMYRPTGLDPAGLGILVVKSSVHFRADFGPMASEVLVVESPGPNTADLARLPFTRLRKGLRVTPLGEIIAVEKRGTSMGNRGGPLHDETKRLTRKRWVNKHWIACVLEFRGRSREVMAPRRYTELFFLDEAAAFAAGHRPCFECRRADFTRYAGLWGALRGRNRRGYVAEMDGRCMPSG